MNNIAPLEEAKEPDRIIVDSHKVIDRLLDLLKTNPSWYSPWHHLFKWVTAWEDEITWIVWFKVDTKVLEILYDIDSDTITIQHNDKVNMWDVDSRLAVGQANMILFQTQQKSKARVSALFRWDWTWDQIVIQNASEIKV